MDRLLALANGAALHKALSKEVPAAKYRTVARWVGARRTQPPAEMVPAILHAFGIHEKEAAPDIPERLEVAVGKLEALVSGLPEIVALARKVADDAERERDEQRNDAGSGDPVTHDPETG